MENTAAADKVAVLIAHILARFHETHRAELPELVALAKAHAPGLLGPLQDLAVALELHMFKEEARLFPMMEQGGNTLIGHLIEDLTAEWSVLIVSTLAFTTCFMVWMMFGVIGIPMKKTLGLNATEFGLLTATPVLTGSLIRVPLGIWTDKYGGRIVMACLMAHRAGHLADELRHRLLALPGHRPVRGPGRRLVLVGTPYVARWFPRNRQGMAMGVYGAGNSGAAVNKFVAPALLVAFGWTMVPQVYAAIMLGTLIIFWLGSAQRPAHLVPPTPALRASCWR
jgi:hypothetical protein